jgi:ribose transport system permease protein
MKTQTLARPAALRSFATNPLTIAVLAIVALFVIGEISAPGFLSFGHVMSVIRLSVFLGIVALGQSLVVMAGGEGIDLSVGSIISLGVVVSRRSSWGRTATWSMPSWP